MSEQNVHKGRRGEALALEYLQKAGYTLCAQRFRVQAGEVDLIMKDKDTVVFIEVKARYATAYGTPGEAVTVKKQQHIAQAAQAYLAREGLFDAPARFDVVEVRLRDGHIQHFENAFLMV